MRARRKHRVAQEDQHKLAFTWENEQYIFTRAVFGLKHLSHLFQRVMSHLLGHLAFVRIFVDNIGIISATLDDHKVHVAHAISILNDANLKLRVFFAAPEMETLRLF